MNTSEDEHISISTLTRLGWSVRGKTLYSPQASMRYIPEEEMDLAMEVMEKFDYAWGGVLC